MDQVSITRVATFHRVVDHEAQLADGSDEAVAIVGILGRKHTDVLCGARKAEEDCARFPDEEIIDSCGRERLGYFLCLQRIER